MRIVNYQLLAEIAPYVVRLINKHYHEYGGSKLLLNISH